MKGHGVVTLITFHEFNPVIKFVTITVCPPPCVNKYKIFISVSQKNGEELPRPFYREGNEYFFNF